MNEVDLRKFEMDALQLLGEMRHRGLALSQQSVIADLRSKVLPTVELARQQQDRRNG